jgi:uncharacterized glyoxalase superfamily protein PhnB
MYEDVGAAIEWLCRVFEAKESLRHIDPNGRITHAQIIINGHEVMLGWPGPNYHSPKRHGPVSHALLVNVDDVDAHYDHVRTEGAETVSRPETRVFGERSYEAVDPEGHHWYFSQHVADVAPDTWGAITPSLKNGA